MRPLVIDNFAGGGGASSGIEAALRRPVDLAINHDEAAVAVHAANHPETRHYCQSIFAVDPREVTDGAPVLLAWFSPDCKHHSKAKGGKPRDRNIRDMAWVVPHWIERLQRTTPGGEGAPQVIMLENVEEFRHWGPLDAAGMPIPERKGEEFDLWVRRIRRLGYKVEHRELRACDYGAPTSRKRLFLIARRDGRPIVWPEPTHGRPGSAEVRSGKLKPWRTAAECIDWSLDCPSIFDRPRPLKDATCRRIAAGVMRYVVNSASPFLIDTAFVNTRASRVFPPQDPLRAITAQASHAVVSPSLVGVGSRRGQSAPAAMDVPHCTITAKADGAIAAASLAMLGHGERRRGEAARLASLDEPLGTTMAGGGKHAAVAAFLHKYRPNSDGAPADGPMPTVTANSFVKRGGGAAPIALTSAHLEQANTGLIGHDAREPVSTIVGKGSTQRLVETTLVEAGTLPDDLMAKAVRTAAFLVKYYGNEKDAHSVGDPLGTVTTRERFAVVTVTIDAITFVLVDIGMRMLTPRELANAQGFPADYVLDPECWYVTDSGTRKFGRLPKSHQIAKIGNSVCPPMSEALVRANLPEHCAGAEPEAAVA